LRRKGRQRGSACTERKRERIKIWGEGHIVEDDAALPAALIPKEGKSRGEQILLFRVLAWDANCPKYIPQRFDAADISRPLEHRRIDELESKIAQLLDAETRQTAASRSGQLRRSSNPRISSSSRPGRCPH